MATRWIVPCGCELIYDADGDNIIMREYNACAQHSGTSIENAHTTAINFCQSIQPENPE